MTLQIDRKNSLDQPPKFGLKLRLDHEFPLQSKQGHGIRPSQLFDVMPLTARYFKYCVGMKLNNRRPIMDFLHRVSAQRMYGCPIGGIGGGTIGRGFKGEFCRFQLQPGLYEYVTVPECQFIVNIKNDKNETIYQTVLSTYSKPKNAPESWEWNLNGADCEYTALYPRAWTTYDLSKYGIKLVCRQISPVIPHNYEDSSLPCAVFAFSALNVSNEHRNVSVTLTWTEVLNKSKNAEVGSYTQTKSCGVYLRQKIGESPCTFTISKNNIESQSLTEDYTFWNSAKTSHYVWECIQKHGKLSPDPRTVPTPRCSSEKENKQKQNKVIYCDSIALSSVLSLEPQSTGSTELSLVWDMPTIKYRKDEKKHKRFYTKFYSSDGNAGSNIATYALNNFTNWETQLNVWQESILNNGSIPDWLKSALFNELYYVADGGTIWLDVHDEYPDTDPRKEFGLFGYLEGHEYRMYNSYDVHFYASFALAQLWPNLQVVIQYMFRDTVAMETEKSRKSLYDGKIVKYKTKDSIPHDLGDPGDMPFFHINAYNIHDVSDWKDLNFKFILQVIRDYHLMTFMDTSEEKTGSSAAVWPSKRYLADMYPACVTLLRRAAAWDRDGDGLIENDGTPDQTYDIWVMTGPSAYCGGLWVASVKAVHTMANILGHEDDEREFGEWLQRAQRAYQDKLWAGTHYRFDTKPCNENVIMADQLAGHWFLRASGLNESVFPEENVQKALKTIYENNVLHFKNGTMGAVNGFVREGKGHIETRTMHSEEIWVGTTYGVSALMIFEGMHKEAFATAGGLYHTLTQMGLSFETPEALYENGNHRSIAYMRPLAVWALHQALLARPVP
ncbi:non-lysosomal glucosylceramidase isoform X1 [Bombyx mori]|uniref:Non-lysosomal glucosylceramidase n=2 Tax=Bombyx mori TaxID=7091 RepID=A0A8R2QW32_BOMMO|nr:non-lysosomal glucosylceramidase isoform X1 [Bombyx mori]